MMSPIVLLLVVGVSGVFTASQVPKCTPDVIAKVNSQWKKTGVPQHVMSMTEPFTAVAGTKSGLAQQGQCKKFRFLDGKLDDMSDNMKLPCSEKNGKLQLPDSMSYVILKNTKTLATMRCSQDGPNPTANNPVVVAICATAKATKADIKNTVDTVTSLGFAVQYYTC